MQFISRDIAAEQERELRRRAEAARLARQARQARQARKRRPREGAAPGARLSSGQLSSGQPGRGRLSRGWRRLAGALADGARAQRRLAVLNASLDQRLPQPHQPPATYREFLARTAGPLLREPSACARSHGHPAG